MSKVQGIRRTRLKKAWKNDVMEKYRKLTINDVIRNHDKKNNISLVMKSFMRTNKWLIREFPEELGIKEAILATQFSSLFDYELRAPSLVYAIFE